MQDIADLLDELAAFGRRNDAQATDRAHKMLNITCETGCFLELMVKATRARRVLEIGTSNGYSTLWLAKAVEATGGYVTSVDHCGYKLGLAEKNLRRGGLAHRVELVQAEAGEFLRAQKRPFDLIFLDAERGEYIGWWPHLAPLIAPGGLLIGDNAISRAGELDFFAALIADTPGCLTSTVGVGKGELVVHKEASRSANWSRVLGRPARVGNINYMEKQHG